MAIHFVQNSGGRARVCWPGAMVLFAALLFACAIIPASGFWLAFGDGKLVSTSLISGFGVACLSFGAILGTSLRRPVVELPTRAEPAASDRDRT
jgi:hypothetical protein